MMTTAGGKKQTLKIFDGKRERSPTSYSEWFLSLGRPPEVPREPNISISLMNSRFEHQVKPPGYHGCGELQNLSNHLYELDKNTYQFLSNGSGFFLRATYLTWPAMKKHWVGRGTGTYQVKVRMDT